MVRGYSTLLYSTLGPGVHRRVWPRAREWVCGRGVHVIQVSYLSEGTSLTLYVGSRLVKLFPGVKEKKKKKKRKKEKKTSVVHTSYLVTLRIILGMISPFVDTYI